MDDCVLYSGKRGSCHVDKGLAPTSGTAREEKSFEQIQKEPGTYQTGQKKKAKRMAGTRKIQNPAKKTAYDHNRKSFGTAPYDNGRNRNCQSDGEKPSV